MPNLILDRMDRIILIHFKLYECEYLKLQAIFYSIIGMVTHL